MSHASLNSILAFLLLGQPQDLSDVKTKLTDTDLVDVGKVISRGPASVTVKNDFFTRAFQTNAQTEIRRVDSSQIQVGDLVAIRCHLADNGIFVADSISANVDRWDGVITKVLKDTAYIQFDAPAKGIVQVTFDGETEFGYCNPGCSLNDLKVGRYLETIGFVLGKKKLRATRVLHIQNH